MYSRCLAYFAQHAILFGIFRYLFCSLSSICFTAFIAGKQLNSVSHISIAISTLFRLFFELVFIFGFWLPSDKCTQRQLGARALVFDLNISLGKVFRGSGGCSSVPSARLLYYSLGQRRNHLATCGQRGEGRD